MANFKDLSQSNITVLKGLLGFGSTSEVLSCGFVNGNLKKFHGNYTRFDEAWGRLDEGQQQAICDIWDVCNIGNHDVNIGRKTVPTIDTFLIEFKKWIETALLGEVEQEWFDENPNYREDYPPADVMEEHKVKVAETLSKYL